MKVFKKIRSQTSLNMEELPAPKQRNCFHESISFAVIMGQIFGVMPLHGVCSDNFQEVKFRWLSPRVLLAVFNGCAGLVTGGFCVLKFALAGLRLDRAATMMFYFLNGVSSFCFIFIALKWSRILEEYSFVEFSMKNYPTPAHDLKRTNVIISIIFIGLGLVEHLLFIATDFYWSTTCEKFYEEPIATYFQITFPHYFTILPYSTWAAVFVEYGNIMCTFVWNYTDLFIILISVSLTEKFNQIILKIKTTRMKDDKFWKMIREDYNRVSNLIRIVDRYIAALVLVSYADNIFFMCIQLYQSIKERSGVLESIYFFYSFGILVFRIVTVSLFAARLSEAAKKPLKYLHTVSSEHYTLEVSRFIKQISDTPNGITATGFFHISKNFLLHVASTIVTIELMIFEFSPASKETTLSPYNCTE